MTEKRSKTHAKRRRKEPQDREILNAEQAADALGITVRLLLAYARRGKIPGKKLGKEWRFRRSSILAWLGQPDLPNTLEGLLNDSRVNFKRP